MARGALEGAWKGFQNGHMWPVLVSERTLSKILEILEKSRKWSDLFRAKHQWSGTRLLAFGCHDIGRFFGLVVAIIWRWLESHGIPKMCQVWRANRSQIRIFKMSFDDFLADLFDFVSLQSVDKRSPWPRCLVKVQGPNDRLWPGNQRQADGKRNRETAQLRAKFSQKSPKSVGIIQDKPTMDGSILPRVVVVLLSLWTSTNLVLQWFIISSTQSTNRNWSARILRKKISLSVRFCFEQRSMDSFENCSLGAFSVPGHGWSSQGVRSLDCLFHRKCLSWLWPTFDSAQYLSFSFNHT